MSDSPQTQAESSSIRSSAPPLVTLKDLERRSSPSSLEHYSTVASPTDSPTLEGKAKGKVVEVTDVAEEIEEDAPSTPSAPTIAGIEPEQVLNLNDIPSVREETESEVDLENEPLAAKAEPVEYNAESNPAVCETEWKDESSENKAYVEGYNGGGKCEPQPHRLPGRPDPRSEARNLLDMPCPSTQPHDAEQESIGDGGEGLLATDKNFPRGHHHCVECGESSSETPGRESCARGLSSEVTDDLTWQNYYRRFLNNEIVGNQADIRQIEQALGPLESLLADNFLSHPALDEMRWRQELETERRHQRQLQRQRDQVAQQAELQEQTRAQLAARAENQARRGRERAQAPSAAVSTAYFAPWTLPIHPITMRTPGTRRIGVNDNGTTWIPQGITITPSITIGTRRLSQSTNTQGTSSQSTRASAGTSQARNSQAGNSQAGSSCVGSSRASRSQVGSSPEKNRKKKHPSKH
ncbi:hypothetical protein BDZ45DRAFT_744632 [Acephala macrosclerotiorum]|nr:hypothetical protein BDZ45DRAFT_744632 [Acephala macrosclerotiorum]